MLIECSDAMEEDACWAQAFAENFSLKMLTSDQKADFLEVTRKFMRRCSAKVDGVKRMAMRRSEPVRDAAVAETKDEPERIANKFLKEEPTAKARSARAGVPSKPNGTMKGEQLTLQDLRGGLRFMSQVGVGEGFCATGTIIGLNVAESRANIVWDNGAMEQVPFDELCKVSFKIHGAVPKESGIGRACGSGLTEAERARQQAGADSEMPDVGAPRGGDAGNGRMNATDLNDLFSSMPVPESPRPTARAHEGGSENPAEKKNPRVADE